MIEQFQKQFRVLSWLAVAVFALGALFLAQIIRDRASADTDVVSVSGVGKVVAKPDVAVADLAITTQGSTAQSAQDESNKKSVAVVKYLKDAGIDDEDIKTSSYNIYPQYDYSVPGRNRINSYQVTQSLTVKIRDLDKANAVLDGVVGAGVNQVNNFRFDIDDPEELKAEARQQAIDDAKDRADELEDQLGVNLGKLVGFSEGISGYPMPMYYKAELDGRGGMGGGNPAPDLPVGENEVVVSVTLTYKLR